MRVVIADDTLLVREGIASVLRRAGVDVVAEAARHTRERARVGAGYRNSRAKEQSPVPMMERGVRRRDGWTLTKVCGRVPHPSAMSG